MNPTTPPRPNAAGRAVRLLGPAVLALALGAGCGPVTAHVTGEVSYEGQPVTHGYIQFLPTGPEGQAVGGPITDGKYNVAKIPVGPALVKIEATKAVTFARSSEEMKKMAEAAKHRGDRTGLIEKADTIPPDAIGNSVTVEIKPGKHTLDFRLTKPQKR